MDPKELKTLESQCVQEQPAFCIAACPLHVDARQVLAHISMGQRQEARDTLDRTLPFADIIGRICDHPCQLSCKHGEVGDPIAIAELERICVRTTLRRVKPLRAPEKDGVVAVIGGGLDAMSAAFDLAVKGFRIEMWVPQDRLVSRLKEIPEHILPLSVIEQTTESLLSLGIRMTFLAEADQITAVVEAADAVFVGQDAPRVVVSCLPQNGFGQIATDPLTLQTATEKIFAAESIADGGNGSVIFEAAHGRWAAASIDRFLKRVSLTAGRERQGPFKSRLYTSVEGIAPLQRIRPADPAVGYNSEEAQAEAMRCLQCECMVCVEACAYLEHFGGYPKTYVRDIYNSEKVVYGKHPANLLINSCSLCGLCEEVCPERFSMADLCLSQRRNMCEGGRMPLSAHEFVLDDMTFANGKQASLFCAPSATEKPAIFFFPGCQFAGSLPDRVVDTYDYLCEKIDGGVGIALGCCGAPAHWAGRKALTKASHKRFLHQWESFGSPEVITGCTSCHTVFAQYLPQVKTVTLWEVLGKIGLPRSVKYSSALSSAAVHDPCTARYMEKTQENVRALLKTMGYGTKELTYGGRYTTCCGFGGLMSNANPQVAKEMIKRRAEEDTADYITYCAVCRDMLAKAGKRAAHLLDLMFFRESDEDPFTRSAPGFSRRRENRIFTKKRLLQKIGKQSPEENPQEDKSFNILIAPEVREKMEQRRILDDDVKDVIKHIQESTNCFTHQENGHLLGFYTPSNVTFWVEYSRCEDGFLIHNTYVHRMKIGKVVRI